MNDLTGMAVTEVRDFPAVAAITARVRGGELAPGDAPPAVVLRRLGVSLSPGGAGKARAGLQGALIAALCFGATYQQAAALAGAVADAVHYKRARQSGTRLIHLSLVESLGDATRDPDTSWPFETVVFQAIGAAQAVAA